MKKIQDVAGFLFIIAVGILSAVSVLGIWDIFGKEVINKSFQTLGLLAVVAVIVIIAGRFIEGRKNEGDSLIVEAPNELFMAIRHATVIFLIIFASMLALLGVLAIWDVITDKDVLYKTIGTLATLAFGSFIVVMTCLERENNPIIKKQGNKSISAGAILLILIAIYLFSMLARY